MTLQYFYTHYISFIGIVYLYYHFHSWSLIILKQVLSKILKVRRLLEADDIKMEGLDPWKTVVGDWDFCWHLR